MPGIWKELDEWQSCTYSLESRGNELILYAGARTGSTRFRQVREQLRAVCRFVSPSFTVAMRSAQGTATCPDGGWGTGGTHLCVRGGS